VTQVFLTDDGAGPFWTCRAVDERGDFVVEARFQR
jgi:hypothetical protein